MFKSTLKTLLCLSMLAFALEALASGPRRAGEPCVFDSDCRSNKCHINKRVCEMRGGGFPHGWPCTFDSDCGSRNCDISRRTCN